MPRPVVFFSRFLAEVDPAPIKAQWEDNPCATFQFWSNHPGGAYFAFGDGSVRYLGYGADKMLQGLATRGGGELVGE